MGIRIYLAGDIEGGLGLQQQPRNSLMTSIRSQVERSQTFLQSNEWKSPKTPYLGPESVIQRTTSWPIFPRERNDPECHRQCSEAHLVRGLDGCLGIQKKPHHSLMTVL